MNRRKVENIRDLNVKRRVTNEHVMIRYWELDKEYTELWRYMERVKLEIKLSRTEKLRTLQTKILLRLEDEAARLSRQREKYSRWSADLYYWMTLYDCASNRLRLVKSCKAAADDVADEFQTINFV
ncbi:hypothetical protein DW917_09495 [Prevotella sp. AM42-24]|uniref:hypothetical protein n=1 Tax=Prevotella sp. AM42-24 TaxID=2293125 RepID=UPI000E516357|nr:hypothetical protein [Prevotella sp. AM42-24]RGH41068.1 hypothetical protein DW917_09495 [Prevotella sp. AM42-24]